MHILLVEDTAGTRRPLAYLLAGAGHVVRAVGTLAAARAELSAGGRFDAAVVNRLLPDGDGCDLAADLSARGVPAVAFSGLAYPGDAARSLAAGFAVHLAKPAGLADVLAAIAAAAAAAAAGLAGRPAAAT